MANEKDPLRIKQWFDTYTSGFCTGYERIDSALCLKVRHTKNVAIEILDIANSLELSAGDCYLAEILALLHDIGRFEQFLRYHTYSDIKSQDHAALGIEIIDKTGVLKSLDATEQALIRAVIGQHNRAVLPDTAESRTLFFLKLLRDADKIDILRVVIGHYSGRDTNEAIPIGIPDVPAVSDAVLENVAAGRTVRFEDVRTLNDFKLLQVGWVYDLNFPRTYEIIRHRNYLDKIAAVLPRTDRVLHALAAARRSLMQPCMEERSRCECQIP